MYKNYIHQKCKYDAKKSYLNLHTAKQKYQITQTIKSIFHIREI